MYQKLPLIRQSSYLEASVECYDIKHCKIKQFIIGAIYNRMFTRILRTQVNEKYVKQKESIKPN